MGSLVFLTQFIRVEAAPLCACPCTVTWNQCQNPMVSGYCLYFGITNSTATSRLDVGMTNMVILKNLLSSSNYFLYVVSYDSTGIESAPSVEIFYTPQALSALKLTKLTNGILSLHFLATTGAVGQVEYTPCLNPPQWQTLGSATADANGNVTMTDPLTGHPPARFYRTDLP